MDIPSSSNAELVIPGLWEETIAPETVRPDRNLERWAIWEPANSRHKPHTRTIQREIRMPDGNVAVAKVEVGFSNHGMLTTEDQRTCYALIKHWENSGRPSGAIAFSRQQLTRILKKTWGKNVNRILTNSLTRLRFTPFTWERSYYDNKSQETVEMIDTFTILSELKLARRVKDSSETKTEPVTRESSWYEFNSRILTNLLSHYTKPVFLETIIGFRSDIAQILYTHLDLILADKTRYERRTKELFVDLGIDGTSYRYPSKRVQTLEPALRELQGCPLSTGVLKSIVLETTVDGEDYKIVACKGKQTYKAPKPVVRERKLKELKPQSFPKKKSATDVSANSPAKIILEEMSPTEVSSSLERSPISEAEIAKQALEQVKYFHQVFFKSGETVHPSPKEVAQAQSHLTRLGEERSRYLVTFAMREAKKTDFAIQTYGGILQYESRALAEFEANNQKRYEASLQKVREGHQKRFYAAYLDYIGETYAHYEKTPTKAFLAFLEQEEKDRERRTTGVMAKHPTMQRVAREFEAEEAKLKRFFEHQGDYIYDFWTWDAQCNPEGLAKISDVR